MAALKRSGADMPGVGVDLLHSAPAATNDGDFSGEWYVCARVQ